MPTACEVLEKECGGKVFLTPSCTSALEISCRLTLSPGDEVILPSWTFPSCANAVILAGGVPVFVDVNQDLNIDPTEVLKAITTKTKAVMPVHYAGVVCEMQEINRIAREYGLYVIEDAAQAIGNWKVSGDLGCLSFHSTKNVSCGEGGAIIVNNPSLLERVEIFRDCGTTKAKYRRGETSGYDWVDVGSSCLMSDHLVPLLETQLRALETITAQRMRAWRTYRDVADQLEMYPRARFPGNGHLFWFEIENKWDWIKKAREMGVKASSHYEALHLTIPGRKYGRACGPILRATQAMERLVKLDTSVDDPRAFLQAASATS